MLQLGTRIAQIIRSLKMTQQQFGAALGVSRIAVGDWIREAYEPKTHHLIKMAEMSGCSLDWLLTGIGRGPRGKPVSTYLVDASALVKMHGYIDLFCVHNKNRIILLGDPQQ